jgi:hypothetical protein
VQPRIAVRTLPRMTTPRQKAAARRNIKKAAAAARRKKTISKLPKKTRTALAKQANKVKRQKRA